MNDTPLTIEPIAPGIVSLKIASDDQRYLENSTIRALAAAAETLTADQSIRAIVVEGGARYFSAGASRATLISADPANAITNYVAEVPRLLLGLPVPTIAAIAGHAIGGGLVLGLWCDIALLGEESLYGVNFMALGFTPGMGATMLLEEAVGALLARELLFTGRLMKGRELKAAGGPIAPMVVPCAEVRSRAIAIAQEIAEAPREALVLLKQTLSAKRSASLERALKDEHAMHAALFARAETRSRIAERYIAPDLAMKGAEVAL
jgi:polyketide biosynthesis enoyl-CoA hydratase PksI